MAEPSVAPPTAPPTVVGLKADDYSLGTLDFAKPSMKEIPELIHWMLEAVWAAPEGSRTLHKLFVPQFEGRITSSGFKIGHELAKRMATCCRATILAERGGNRNQRSPDNG
jgi:hypothetical protein